MKKFNVLIFTLILSLQIFAQNKFQMSFAQTGKDYNSFNSIKRLADGYMLVGTTGSTTTSLNDMLLVKTDFNLNIVWSKVIGTGSVDEKIEYLSKCVVFEADGIVVLGNTMQPGTRDFLLTKLDYSGGVRWSKSYGFPISGSNYNDNASTLCKTTNGYYLCGYLNTATTGYGLIIKVDTSGVQQWSKSFIPLTGATCTLWSGVGLKNNDLVVGGGYGNGAWDSYLMYITSTGTIKWQKNFIATNYDIIYDIAEDQNNSILCAMMHDGFYAGSRGALLNADITTGAVNWAKTFDLDLVNDRDGQLCNVIKNPDNTTMIAFIYSNVAAGSFKQDIVIAKLDAGANIIWAKKYGTSDADTWPKLFPNGDSYLIATDKANNRSAAEQFYLLGLNSDGGAGCNETALAPVVTTLTGYQWLDFSTSLQTVTPTVATQILTATTPSVINKNVLCINIGINATKNDAAGYNTPYKIAPNPSSNEINIISEKTIFDIEIINTLGQVLAKHQSGNSVQISELPTGAYILKINNRDYLRFIKE